MTFQNGKYLTPNLRGVYLFQISGEQQPGDCDVESQTKAADQAMMANFVLNPGRMSSERALSLGDKAYRCTYEGCGRLYTTLHHLKVNNMAEHSRGV